MAKKKQQKVSKAIKKFVKKAVKHIGELKQGVLVYGILTMDNNAGSKLLLNLPTAGGTGQLQQGAQYNQRIGDKIDVVGISLNLVFRITSLSVNTAEIVRIMVLREKQPEGTSLVTSELLNGAGAGASVFAPLRVAQKHRFEIFLDKTITINNKTLMTPGASPETGSKYSFRYKKMFKTPKRTTFYNNSGLSTISAIEQGAWYCILWTQGANVDYTGQSDILYRDV